MTIEIQFLFGKSASRGRTYSNANLKMLFRRRAVVALLAAPPPSPPWILNVVSNTASCESQHAMFQVIWSSQPRASPLILFRINYHHQVMQTKRSEARYSIGDVTCNRREVTEVFHVPGTGITEILDQGSGVENHWCQTCFRFQSIGSGGCRSWGARR